MKTGYSFVRIDEFWRLLGAQVARPNTFELSCRYGVRKKQRTGRFKMWGTLFRTDCTEKLTPVQYTYTVLRITYTDYGNMNHVQTPLLR